MTIPTSSTPGYPEPIPATIVFAEPPGLAAVLTVTSEVGDVMINVTLLDRPFLAIVLTRDAALSASLWLTAHVIDLRRQLRGERHD
jgi:hypothetical protein